MDYKQIEKMIWAGLHRHWGQVAGSTRSQYTSFLLKDRVSGDCNHPDSQNRYKQIVLILQEVFDESSR